MLRTPLCGLLGIDTPIIGAPFGPWEQVDLAVALCEARALGSLGTGLRTVDELRAQWERMRERNWLENATQEQRAALKRDLRPVVSIYEQL